MSFISPLPLAVLIFEHSGSQNSFAHLSCWLCLCLASLKFFGCLFGWFWLKLKQGFVLCFNFWLYFLNWGIAPARVGCCLLSKYLESSIVYQILKIGLQGLWLNRSSKFHQPSSSSLPWDSEMRYPCFVDVYFSWLSLLTVYALWVQSHEGEHKDVICVTVCTVISQCIQYLAAVASFYHHKIQLVPLR